MTTTTTKLTGSQKAAMDSIEAEALQFARRSFRRLGERQTDKNEGERKARAAWSVFYDFRLDDVLLLLDDRAKCEAAAAACFLRAFRTEWNRLRLGMLALS